MQSTQRHAENVHPILTWGVLIFMLSGCVSGGLAALSYQAQERANALCAGLYATQDIQALGSKMPILPGQIPSREMLMISEAPNDQEKRGIGALESAIRNCKLLRAAANQPTSASEDILEARISKLRYGLYNGDIPYAVYNYGLAKELKKHTDFLRQPRPSFSTGEATGTQQTLDMNMFDTPNNLNTTQRKSWSCASDHVGDQLYTHCN